MTGHRIPVGLIVDWGGVLTTPINQSFSAFIAHEAIDSAMFSSAMRRMHDEPGSALHQLEVGELGASEFEERLASQFLTTGGDPVSPERLLERMFSDVARNAQMRSIVAAARERGWSTAVLSNAWGMPYDEADLRTIVETVLLSDKIRLRKPDPAAYLHAAAAIGLPPEACVFVDDLRRNALAAESVGMVGFQYRGGDEHKLEKLLALREANARFSGK